MLSAETKKHLAKAMNMASADNHELLIIDFNQHPPEDESGVEVLCSMANSTPENIMALAQEALTFFAEPQHRAN